MINELGYGYGVPQNGTPLETVAYGIKQGYGDVFILGLVIVAFCAVASYVWGRIWEERCQK
jgi:hypothetical protein